MMNYEEFKQEIVDNVKDYLDEKYANAEVSIADVTKNNDTHLDGLQIKLEDSNICPTIYLNDLYTQYEDTNDIEAILSRVARAREGAEIELPFDVKDLTNWEKTKDHLDCRVISKESNQEYLQDKPHLEVAEDLAVVYAVRLGGAADGIMNAVVTDRMMENWGVSLEELNETAMNNMETLSPVNFKTMQEVLAEMMFPGRTPSQEEMDMFFPPMEGPALYVLTNEDKVYGAKAILNEKVMDDIAEKIGGDFVILPSSVHEVLILSDAEHMDRRALEDMVQSVNQTEVMAQDVLSDHVYCYDSKEHELVRAETYIDRVNDRRAEITEGRAPEKKPIKDLIAEKKEESVKLHPEKSIKGKSLENSR